MDELKQEKFLGIALMICGAIFFTIYPLSLIWPSGWQWHSGHGQYYLQMICGVYAVLGVFLIAAARNPSEHRSLISFTIWSSIAMPALWRCRPYMTDRRPAICWATCPRYCLWLPCCGICLRHDSRGPSRSPHASRNAHL